MKEAIKLKTKVAFFYLDSQVVVNRANGLKPREKNKNDRMDKFQQEVFKLAEKFDEVSFRWVSRDKNIIADNLSKKACWL